MISGKEIIVNVISSPIDGYALVKVWNPELRREVIEAVAMNEIKGVKVSV